MPRITSRRLCAPALFVAVLLGVIGVLGFKSGNAAQTGARRSCPAHTACFFQLPNYQGAETNVSLAQNSSPTNFPTAGVQSFLVTCSGPDSETIALMAVTAEFFNGAGTVASQAGVLTCHSTSVLRTGTVLFAYSVAATPPPPHAAARSK
jgi:hypothetical protein